MGGRGAADIAFAWPSAMIAPLTREAAVQTFAADRLKDEDRASLEEKYALSADGLAIASLGLADDVIDPIETRKHIIAAMELLYSKQDEAPAREHGNMPL
jgi:propionyl-CoA carboxylase beta chain